MGRTRRADLEDPSQSRPAHTNTSTSSSAARPVKTVDTEPFPDLRSTTSPPDYRSPKLDQSSSRGPRSSSKTTLSALPSSDKPTLYASHVGHVPSDGTLSTPLPDYKHAANQTNKARAAAEAAKAASTTQRASSSTSGNSGERNNGSMARPPATRGDQQARSISISSAGGSSSVLTGSSCAPSLEAPIAKPFTERYGRRYLRDPTLPYPLPCDLPEIHRQTLRTLLLCQVFNGPICSPAFDKKPPKRVLEVACGSGFWSVMCHRYFARRGFNSIAFTGVDIAPIAHRMDIDDDMNWRFVQHDLRKLPLPFRDDEFNLIMTKDLSMVTPATGSQQKLIDEYIRILKPGGTWEIWDGDHCLRVLLPPPASTTNNDEDSSEDEEQAHSNAMGVYTLSPQTQLGTAQNQYILDYNGWVVKAMEARKLTHMPCAEILPKLLQESEILTDVGSRRLAIPLGEVRWEREGVGGTVTKGSHGISTKGKGKGREGDRRVLTAGQAALRRTALGTFVNMIESLELVLREASGKDPSEWDRWQESMMNDLLNSDGTSWGECLEVCAGWARKKKPSTPTAN